MGRGIGWGTPYSFDDERGSVLRAAARVRTECGNRRYAARGTCCDVICAAICDATSGAVLHEMRTPMRTPVRTVVRTVVRHLVRRMVRHSMSHLLLPSVLFTSVPCGKVANRSPPKTRTWPGLRQINVQSTITFSPSKCHKLANQGKGRRLRRRRTSRRDVGWCVCKSRAMSTESP